MRTLMVLGTVLVVLAGAGMEARGQPPPGPPEEPEPRELIETVRIWRMTEELDLSEEQIAQFFPKLKKLEDAEKEHSEKIAKTIGELDELLKSAKPSPSALSKKMDELEAIEKEFEKKRAKLKEEMREVLSVEQQAKLVVFRFKFHREMREIIRGIRKHRRGHTAPSDERLH